MTTINYNYFNTAQILKTPHFLFPYDPNGPAIWPYFTAGSKIGKLKWVTAYTIAFVPYKESDQNKVLQFILDHYDANNDGQLYTACATLHDTRGQAGHHETTMKLVPTIKRND